MSLEAQDVNGNPIEISLYSNTLTLRTEGRDTEISFDQFAQIVVYFCTNWRGRLPDEIINTLASLSQCFQVVPKTKLFPEDRNAKI